MEKNTFQELSKLCSANSILVINSTGIYRLFTPFKATCIIEVGIHVIGQEVTVIAVKMSPEYKLIYIIQNKAYFHHYFVIISKPRDIQSGFN